MKIEDITLFKEMHRAKQQNDMKTFFDLRNKILEKNLRLVLSRVQHIYGHQNEDLIEAGNEALINIIDKFDINRGTEFSTFAVPWIDQSIYKEIKKIKTPISIPYHKYERVRSALKKFNNTEEVSAQDISIETGIQVGEVIQILEILKSPISLNYTPEDSDEELFQLIDIDQEQLEEKIEKNILKQDINEFLKKYLTEKELKVIIMRYGMTDGKIRPLEEIARTLKVTRERVRQIESKALRKLKKTEEKENFAIYMDKPDEYLKK